MRKAILQNDVIDVIYDSICGYPLDKAYEILENHRAGKYIPIEWLEMFMQKYKIEGGNEYKLLHFMVTEWKKWRKENEK